MAKGKKHPVSRVRATVAGIDLFFPRKSTAAKRRLANPLNIDLKKG